MVELMIIKQKLPLYLQLYFQFTNIMRYDCMTDMTEDRNKGVLFW